MKIQKSKQNKHNMAATVVLKQALIILTQHKHSHVTETHHTYHHDNRFSNEILV